MREIINLHVGHCGNQIGSKFWDYISDEHSIDEEGVYKGDNDLKLEKIDVFYEETAKGKHKPRAILTDLEPGTIDLIRGGSQGKLFKPENYIFGTGGGGNNWARGHYTAGSEIIDLVMDSVRKEVEKSDHPQGFQYTHSISGGTGSGLGTLIMSKIRDTYPDLITGSFTVCPSPSISDIPTEPYNATFSIHQLVENIDEVFVYDNEALLKILSRTFRGMDPSYTALNEMIASCMSNVTASLRYPGQRNSDLRKMAVNLVPFPRIHFFNTVMSPLKTSIPLKNGSMNAKEIINEMFDSKSNMCSCDPKHGRYLTAASIFRGKVSTYEVEQELATHLTISSPYFVEWIPRNITSSIINTPPRSVPLSGTLIGSSTSIQEIFKRVGENLTQLFRK